MENEFPSLAYSRNSIAQKWLKVLPDCLYHKHCESLTRTPFWHPACSIRHRQRSGSAAATLLDRYLFHNVFTGQIMPISPKALRCASRLLFLGGGILTLSVLPARADTYLS